jgi:hypothetical protein
MGTIVGIGIKIQNTRASGLDANAAAFIAAAGITDPTQINAINALVISLKTAGVWTKSKAIYPMIGGSASSHKFNLLNPVDTDAGFRIGFSGGWTHNANGALSNGVNAYGDTHIIPNTDLSASNNGFTAHYLRNNSATTNDIIGTTDGSTSMRDLGTDGSAAYYRYYVSANSQAAVLRNDKSIIWNRYGAVAGNVDCWRDGTKFPAAGGTFVGKPTREIYMGCLNNNGVASGFSTAAFAFLAFGDLSLTDGEAAAFTTALDTYQLTLGRNV